MKTFRLVIGFLIGFAIFVVLIPYLLVTGSTNPDLLFNLKFTSNFYFPLIIALPLFCTGALFAIWSNIFLFSVGKGGPVDVFNVAISPRSQNLVMNGPYRYCRHPMVFGVLCVYLSISIFLNSLSEFLLILACTPFFIVYLKLTEEKRLLKDFGDEFVKYKATTPMIIPFTKRRKR